MKTKLYNLTHYIGNRKDAVVMYQKPIALIKWKQRVLQNTSHRCGVLKIEENEKSK